MSYPPNYQPPPFPPRLKKLLPEIKKRINLLLNERFGTANFGNGYEAGLRVYGSSLGDGATGGEIEMSIDNNNGPVIVLHFGGDYSSYAVMEWGSRSDIFGALRGLRRATVLDDLAMIDD